MPDSIDTAFDDQLLIMAVEGGAFHQPMFETRADEYQPKLREMIRRGLNTDGVSYSRALERRRQFITDMEVLAEKADVLLTPSTPTPALADVTNTGHPHVPGSLDVLRAARHINPFGAGGFRPSIRASARGLPLCRSEIAGGGPLVRGGLGRAPAPAGVRLIHEPSLKLSPTTGGEGPFNSRR